MSHIGRPGGSFSRMQLDFIEMPSYQGLRYILVVVCIFSRWVEVCPTRKSDSLAAAKMLLRELIPRYGMLVTLESDRGT